MHVQIYEYIYIHVKTYVHVFALFFFVWGKQTKASEPVGDNPQEGENDGDENPEEEEAEHDPCVDFEEEISGLSAYGVKSPDLASITSTSESQLEADHEQALNLHMDLNGNASSTSVSASSGSASSGSASSGSASSGLASLGSASTSEVKQSQESHKRRLIVDQICALKELLEQKKSLT